MAAGFFELKGDPINNKVVNGYKPFCWGGGNDEIDDFSTIALAGGVHKFSQLCGFNFISKYQEEHPLFQIVFKPAYRSKFHRQTRSQIQSRWFIVVPLNKKGTTISIIDKAMLNEYYGFDVDVFMQSACFKKWSKIFQEKIDAMIIKAEEFIEENIIPLNTIEIEKIPFANEAKDIIGQLKRSVELIPFDNVNNKTYRILQI